MTITKKLAVLLILLYTAVSSANAQFLHVDGPTHENAILVKFYPIVLSPTPKIALMPAVEFKMGQVTSLQFEGQFGLPVTENTVALQYNYYGLQLRYYFNGYECFSGFYAGAQVGFGTVTFKDDIMITEGKYYASPVGLVIGLQYRINKEFYIDFFGGPQLPLGTRKEIGVGTATKFNEKAFSGLTFRTGLAVCYGF
jgi:hypothetical protein